MTLEDYRKLLDDVKLAQGALNYAVCSDLQRLASAESNNTKAKIAEAYERGLKEAWELAKTIATRDGMSFKKISECFGVSSFTEVYEMDVKEALQKFREYTQKQKEAEESELHVGDEVQRTDNPLVKIIVTEKDSRMWSGFDSDGFVGYGSVKEFSDCWEKTGRHFGEVEHLLKEMKEQDAKN